MPVPNPDTLELARAGALIVGVQRRDAALQREIDRRGALLDVATKGGLLALVGCAFVLAAISLIASGIVAAVIAVVALLVSWMSLVASVAPKAIERELGYQPAELAQLVGYVEAASDGGAHLNRLGERAVRTYLAWREPSERA